MSDTGYPVFFSQPGGKVDTFRITGSSVGASQGSAGLDGRGQAFCTIAKSTNVQTINLNRPLPSGQVPYVTLTPLTANGAANVAVSNSQIILTGIERDDDTAPLSDIDWLVTVVTYNTTEFIL